MTPSPFPARFRRRLAIAFVVVAGFSAGVLAVGEAVIVQSYRTNTFRDRAREHVRDELRRIAAGASPLVVAGRSADAEQPGGPAVVVVDGTKKVSSVESVDVTDVPRSVRTDARSEPGRLVEGRTKLRTGAALVVGTVDRPTGAELYFFFSREELERSLRELQLTLAIGWLVIVVVAGVAGTVIARRTLRPVRRAADAARLVAEGLLDTRLPVDATDEFGEWANAFNEMVAALEQKVEALADAREREQRFAADVAHELRTPIASVLTAASHLAGRVAPSDEEVEEVGEIIVGAARRLDRLASELLELHQLEAGHDVLHLEDLDVVTAVENAVRAHGWSDHVELRARPPVVITTDRQRLDRIVVNVIGNALQHGGTAVDVEISLDDDGASVVIADNGPGIATEDIDRVFDRHYKGSGHRAIDTRSGSGLGLSIALESAQRLGGRLTAGSGQSGGARFTLWLPDHSSPAGAPRPEARRA